MKQSIAIACASGISLLAGCAAKAPEGIEAALLRQDGKMKESIRRNKTRSEKREKWFRDYKYRNDRKYDAWVDKILD